MGLKIEHLDAHSATGTLDGTLPVKVTREGGILTARIAGWLHELQTGAADGVAEMRHAVYAALARYREAQRA